MKTVETMNITELIDQLRIMGVAWVGLRTRKAPILALIKKLENDEYLFTGAYLKVDLSNAYTAPLTHIIRLLRQAGVYLTNEDIENDGGLRVKVIDLLKDRLLPTAYVKNL